MHREITGDDAAAAGFHSGHRPKYYNSSTEGGFRRLEEWFQHYGVSQARNARRGGGIYPREGLSWLA